MDTGLLAGVAIGVVVIATTGFTIIDRRRSKSLREFKDRRERLRDAIMPELRDEATPAVNRVLKTADDLVDRMRQDRDRVSYRQVGETPDRGMPYPYVADDGTIMARHDLGYNFGHVNIPKTEFAKARKHGWQAAGGDLAGTITTVYRDENGYEANRQRLEEAKRIDLVNLKGEVLDTRYITPAEPEVTSEDEGEPLAVPPAPNLGGEGNPDYRGPHYESLLEGQAAAWAPYEMLHEPPEGAAVYAIGEHHYVQPEGENDGTSTDRDPA